MNHTRFRFEDPAHCLLTESPEFRDLDDGVMFFVREVNRTYGKAGEVRRLWHFASKVRHWMPLLLECDLSIGCCQVEIASQRRSRLQSQNVNQFESSIQILSNNFSYRDHSPRLYRGMGKLFF